MKIFTATFYKNNYGSALQAVALSKKLKELGSDPVIMSPPHLLSKKNESPLNKLILFFRPEKNYGPIKKIRRYMQRKIYSEKIKKINRFVEENAVIKPYQKCYEEAEHGNCIMLAGSDQIWNIMNHPIPDFYLFRDDRINSIPKFSYAASVGLSEFDNLQIDYYRRVLHDFDAISLREQSAYNQLKKYLNNHVIRYDVDPTLLFSGEFWTDFSACRLHDKPYIFVYMLRPDKRVIRAARNLAKSRGIDIIYMGLYANRYRGIRTILNGGVEDFLSCIKYADMIVTNSFHGTVFSVLFQKKFASFRISSTSSRVENLLDLTGLTEHLIDCVDEVTVAEQEYDSHTVLERLDTARQSSIEYLTQIINQY